MKELTPQVLAMYLGCEVKFTKLSYSLVHEHCMSVGKTYTLDTRLLYLLYKGENHFKLILRKLDSMTEEEARELVKIETDVRFHSSIEICEIGKNEIWYTDGSRIQGDGFDELQDLYVYFSYMTPEQFAWLLSRRFDLFGLIDSNLAIDKKTLNP